MVEREQNALQNMFIVHSGNNESWLVTPIEIGDFSAGEYDGPSEIQCLNALRHIKYCYCLIQSCMKTMRNREMMWQSNRCEGRQRLDNAVALQNAGSSLQSIDLCIFFFIFYLCFFQKSRDLRRRIVFGRRRSEFFFSWRDGPITFEGTSTIRITNCT